jgi:hypothetical protein
MATDVPRVLARSIGVRPDPEQFADRSRASGLDERGVR